MPKEIIDSRYYGQTEEVPAPPGSDQPATSVPIESTHLHVGWTKDHEHVEVAVLHPGEDFAGWFVQLDRRGINRAIRALRQARDQAYGRDE